MRLSLVFLAAGVLHAQVLSTTSLAGKYFVRHVMFSTDANNNVTDARSILGAIAFDGAGNYTMNGQQVIGTAPPATYNSTGTYTVGSGGLVTLTNPQKNTLTVNARYGVEAVIGSSTEASGNTFDFFAAIPAPLLARPNSTMQGSWTATDFELPARSSLTSLSLDNAGNITAFSANGHAANYNSGANLIQNGNGGTYNVSGDGSGTIALPGAAVLLSPTPRSLYLSKSGNLLMAATAGAHDILIALRNASTPVSLTAGQRFWNAGIRVDSAGLSGSYAGSSSVVSTSLVAARRLHQTGANAINLTQAATFTIAADGTGSAGPTKMAVEQGSLIGANNGSRLDPTGYELTFGVALPSVSGTGVFLNPQGISNAASNAPAGDALSPGEFLAIYGSGFATGTTAAKTLPFPSSLAGVSVAINGMPAPIYFVSAGQIDCIVPYAATGQSATLTVTSNGVVSNSVIVPLSATSPGVFTPDGSGTGDGSITHADGTLVNSAKPAKKGETVVLYASGLGLLTSPVMDGFGVAAVDNAVAPVTVYVGGIAVPASGVSYHGLTAYAGLYQINFTIPATLTVTGELPLALQTPDAFTDLVNVAVQ